jgi:glutamate racemase
LRYTIKKVVGPYVKLVNPAFETAKDLKQLLLEKNLLNENYEFPKYEYFVSDAPERFRRIGGNFLKKEINNLSEIAIDNL